jgi:hypothetical protein
MKFEIKYKPSYALLVASIDQGETLTRSRALTYDPNIEVRTRKREKVSWPWATLSVGNRFG